MLLEKYRSRPVEEILLDLYALKIRERNGEKIEQPHVTLLLGNNRSPVSGFLIDMKNELKENGVVIKLYDSNDLLFVETYAVVGIVIHEAGHVVPLLVNLTTEDLKDLPAVTRLEVKKHLAEEMGRLRSSFGEISISFQDELSTDAAAHYFTKLFLTDLAMALITIGKTNEGKEAIEKVKNIVIARGNDLQVARSNSEMNILFSFDRSYTTNKARQLLIDKCYDVL